MSALQPKIAKKNHLKRIFWRFKVEVIDVGTPGKLVSSACYDTLCLSATILLLD